MPYINNWDEFIKAAQGLYIDDPIKCRFVLKYRHNDGKLVCKLTDNQICLMYLAKNNQDVKRIEKLTSQLMRNMVSK
uniref:Signal recognition particle 9 kDa protein n=1 Tax=Tetranychus urticae TaxID=32264 RepID=T1KZL0_TETUR